MVKAKSGERKPGSGKHPNSLANLKMWKPGQSGNPNGITALAEDELKAAAQVTRSNEDAMLEMLLQFPRSTFAEWAERLGWLSATGEPKKSKITRTLDRLKEDKLVNKFRGRWVLTKQGRNEAEKEL